MVRPLPPGTWGLRFFETVEAVYVRSGALLLGILNEALIRTDDAPIMGTPWTEPIHKQMQGVWLCSDETLFAAYDGCGRKCLLEDTALSALPVAPLAQGALATRNAS